MEPRLKKWQQSDGGRIGDEDDPETKVCEAEHDEFRQAAS